MDQIHKLRAELNTLLESVKGTMTDGACRGKSAEETALLYEHWLGYMKAVQDAISRATDIIGQPDEEPR